MATVSSAAALSFENSITPTDEMISPTAASSSQKKTSKKEPKDVIQRTSEEIADFYAAVSRLFASTLAFLFQRPIRLFRPTKISAFKSLSGAAKASGSSISWNFLANIIKGDGGTWKFLIKRIIPPILINGILGYTIFSTYSSIEKVLIHELPKRDPFSLQYHLVVPFLAGATAGAAQGIISAPLDNIRIIIKDRYEALNQKTAQNTLKNGKTLKAPQVHSSAVNMNTANPLSVLKEVIWGPEKLSLDNMTEAQRKRAEASVWARRGPIMWSISVIKDAVGFGAFFALFDVGRVNARRIGLWLDGVPWFQTRDYCFFTSDGVNVTPNDSLDGADGQELENETPKEAPVKRSLFSKLVQASILLISGAGAGAIYSSAERPFNVLRDAVYRLRMSDYDRLHATGQNGHCPRRIEMESFRSIYKSLKNEYKSKPLRNPFVYTKTSFEKVKKDIRSVGFPEATRRFFIRTMSLIPPYAFGFFAYAIANGDFS